MDIQNKRRECEQFAADHMVECAAELIEWLDTGTLCEGRVRELGAMCAKWVDARDALQIAERMVERAALKACVCCSVVPATALNDSQAEAIKQADAHVTDAGLPAYSELLRRRQP